jgi:hypothetical protein
MSGLLYHRLTDCWLGVNLPGQPARTSDGLVRELECLCTVDLCIPQVKRYGLLCSP